MNPSPSQSESGTLRRILLIHTGGGLGDVLMGTPLVKALKTACPQCQVDYMVRRSCARLVDHNPLVNQVLTLEKDSPSWKEFKDFLRLAPERSYDAAVLLWGKSKLAYMMWLARIPRRIGTASRPGYAWTFTDKIRIASEKAYGGNTTLHASQLLLDFLRPLIGTPMLSTPTFDLDPESQRQADALLSSLDRSRPTVGFHSCKGLRVTPQRWPVAAFAAMLKAIYVRNQVNIVLTGSPHEKDCVDEVARLADIPLLNLAGKTGDLGTLAALTSRCEVFVCPDSGPMHLAAAVGTPALGIYALKEDFPDRWAPLVQPNRRIILHPNHCKRHCIKANCPDFDCYNHVSVEEVAQAVQELLGAKKTAALLPKD